MTPEALVDKQQQIAIGEIRKPVGLQGAVGVTPFGDTLAKLKTPAVVSVKFENGCIRSMTLTGKRMDNRGIVCMFDGCDTIESAEPFRNAMVLIDQSKLPRKRSGEFYHFELVGLTVQTSGGTEVGTVVHVHEYPSVDAIEIEKNNGSHIEIPLTRQAVSEINTAAKRLVIDENVLQEILA